MSRDPSGIYTYPDGTRGSPGTTIFSARYNTFLDDLAVTLNTALPINMGGTGASTAPTAIANLGGVKLAGDTMTGNLSIASDTPTFTLDRGAGTLGPANIAGKAGGLNRWLIQLGAGGESGGNTGSDFYLYRFDDAGVAIGSPPLSINRATGKLFLNNGVSTTTFALSTTNPTLYINKAASGNIANIMGQTNNVNRWEIILGEGSAETGSPVNTGSNFAIRSYTDAGGILNIPLAINRANGGVTLTNYLASTYSLNFASTSVARTWGMAVDATGLVFDDLTASKRVLVIEPWNGTWATIKLPNIPTTASPSNCHISAGLGGEVYLVTSSIRYKKDVRPLEKADADKLLLMEPITYKSKSAADDPDRTWLGFIAEQVAEIEPRLVTYAYLPEDWVDGVLREGAKLVPDGLAYDRISVLAVFKLKEQEERIKALEARLAALEAA